MMSGAVRIATRFNRAKLRRVRTARRLSQRQFAKLIGWSQSSVMMVETGGMRPSLDLLEAVAGRFHVDIREFFGK